MGVLSLPRGCSVSVSEVLWLSQCLLWAVALRGMLDILQSMGQSIRKMSLFFKSFHCSMGSYEGRHFCLHVDIRYLLHGFYIWM